MRLHVLTAITRPENLARIAESLRGADAAGVDLTWHCRFDAAQRAVGGQALKNALLDQVRDDWIWILDDDTVAHPDFFTQIAAHQDAGAIVVSQELPSGGVRYAMPEAMRPDHVDIGQLVVRRALVGDLRLAETYGGDGTFIAALYAQHPDQFVFVEQPLCYYNRLRS